VVITLGFLSVRHPYGAREDADHLALDLTNPLPPSIGALSRWTAEPVKNVWLPATAFIPNAKGYPVLSKACQAFLRAMTKVSLHRL